MYNPVNRFIPTILLLACATALLFIPGCAKDSGPGPEKVTVLLDWTPNTNYSGIYAAMDKGYYAEENLEVEIIQSSGYVLQLVAEGKAQFGVSYQEEVIFARLEGIPVVSIAAVLQHNTSGFASLAEKGIATPADFEGKKYGGWGFPVEEATIQALMEHYKADFSKVEIITTGTVDSLVVLEQEADFVWIYYGWTGVEAELKGMDLNFIELKNIDPALDYYTPVLVSGETLIKENPDLVERFMRATARGYRLAVENPAGAAEALLAGAPELDRNLVMASQQWLQDKYQAGAARWGLQERRRWEDYTRWLYERRLIEEMIDVDKAFTNRFVE
ncbi:MAG: ABC transporter substrate-binding protein [Bacillota bacterium]